MGGKEPNVRGGQISVGLKEVGFAVVAEVTARPG